MPKARVLIADDHPVLLEGIRRLLEVTCDVVGTAQNGRELVAEARRLKPEVVVLDIGMPLLNGVEAMRQIHEILPWSRVIVLTQHTNRAYVRESFRSGAHAYVLKQAAASELLTAVEEALQGRYHISPMIATGEIAVSFNPKVNPSELFGGTLTSRQREVLQLLAEGKSAKQIASILGISVKTVEFHKAAIMDELGLRTAAELTRYAIECGIIA